MSETLLIKALASFTGGPRVGMTAEVPVHLARPALDAGLAIEVESLEARAPGLSFEGVVAPEVHELLTGGDATDKDASNQSGGTWGDGLLGDDFPEAEDEPQA